MKSNPDDKAALMNISLQFKPGDFVTVRGSNGAGKSTLMNAISGVMKPDLGEVRIEGNAIGHLRNFREAALLEECFKIQWRVQLLG